MTVRLGTLRGPLAWLLRRGPLRSGSIGQHGRVAGNVTFEEFGGGFDEALEACGTYGDRSILDQVHASTLRVKHGEAEHERDGVVFDRIEYSWPLLAALLWSAARNGGRLSVLDLGGALGSTYFQNRRFLSELDHVDWAVVEQPEFVEMGRRDIADGRLSFHEDLGAADVAVRPNVAICSSVLQYLPSLDAVTEGLRRTSVTTLIIDRTPVHESDDHVLTIQRVPSTIYRASYPAWILSLPRMLAALSRDWDLVEEFRTLEKPMTTDAGRPFRWIGMTLRRRIDRSGSVSVGRPDRDASLPLEASTTELVDEGDR